MHVGRLTVEERRLEQRPRGGDFGRQIKTERQQPENVLDLLHEVFLDAFGLLRKKGSAAVAYFAIGGGSGDRDVISSARGVQHHVLEQTFEQACARTIGRSASHRTERPLRNGFAMARRKTHDDQDPDETPLEGVHIGR